MAACRAAGRAGMNKTDPHGMGSAESLASPLEADQGLGPALPKVAFVDDDPYLLDGLRRSLRRLNLGWSTYFYQDPAVALASLCEEPVDVVVLDIRMPVMNGVTMAGRLATACPQTLSIVLSGSTDFDVAISSINVGRIFRYLIKPCPTPTLVSAVRAALLSRAHTASASHQSGSAKAAIDLLKSGVIVLGPRGQVLFTNQRAGQPAVPARRPHHRQLGHLPSQRHRGYPSPAPVRQSRPRRGRGRCLDVADAAARAAAHRRALRRGRRRRRAGDLPVPVR